MGRAWGRWMVALVVDGMNVIGSRPDGWWRDRTGAAVRLADRLAALARTVQEPVTLVLDGRPSARLVEGERDGVTVLYARRAGRDAADDRIVELVQTARHPAELEVATSDRALAERVEAAGGRVVTAGELLRRLDQGPS
jgi:predicted RNA-binding protein with PIN domain